MVVLVYTCFHVYSVAQVYVGITIIIVYILFCCLVHSRNLTHFRKGIAGVIGIQDILTLHVYYIIYVHCTLLKNVYVQSDSKLRICVTICCQI